MSKDSTSNHEPNHPYWQLEENIKGKPELEALLHALRASEFKYRTILEELDLGFVEVDKDGVVQKGAFKVCRNHRIQHGRSRWYNG